MKRVPALLLLLAVLAAAPAAAGPADPSIGVCARQDEFAKRQIALDPLVAELSAEENAAKAKRLAKKLALAAEFPEQPVADELGWFRAYVKDCRGWRDPQASLPVLVSPKR